MADRIITDLSDRLLRQGHNFDEVMSFLQLHSYDICMWDDDFLGSLAARYVTATGAGGTDWAVLTPTASAGHWGVLRGITGTTDDIATVLSLPRMFRGEFNAVIAVRYAVDVVTGLKIEVGFKDATATSTAIINALNTPTANATDGVCWIYDTDSTNSRWAAVGVSNATVTAVTQLAAADASTAPVADTYETMVVALLEGDAHFIRYNADGERRGYLGGDHIYIASTQRATINLAPWVYFQTRNTTSKNCDVDFFKVWQLRRS